MLLKKINNINFGKYRIHIVLFVVFAIVSNTQIRYLENKFDNLYEGIEEVEILGTIISEKRESSYKSSFTVEVEKINGNKKFKGTNLIIYVKKDYKFEYGDLIKIKGMYKKANTRTNYKTFDYREYLKEKNIYGIVNVDENISIIKKDNLNSILIFFNKIREEIKFNLNKILGEESNITIGILLGDTTKISEETIDDFKTSSIYHILAVSGAHVRNYYNRTNNMS